MPKRKRDKSRSKTPEIPWEILLAEGAPLPPKRVIPGGGSLRSRSDVGDVKTSTSSSSKAPVDNIPVSAEPEPPAIDMELAKKVERDAWRLLVGKLGALKEDPQIDAMLRGRHPELHKVAETCGAGAKKLAAATLDQAQAAARGWFARGLRGSNRQGPAERTKLLTDLIAQLKAHTTALLSLAGTPEQSRLERLLEEGPAAEEGPLICTLLQQEVEGSRYENLWISRQAAGRYVLGDDHDGSGLPNIDQDGARVHPRVCVVVKAKDGKLLIDGFYHEGEDDFLNPARVPIGPFLSVYFEGLPLKEALAHWKNGAYLKNYYGTEVKAAASAPSVTSTMLGMGMPAVQLREVAAPAPMQLQPASLQEPPREAPRVAPLPPGWELRESRSKKGVYFYANPAMGLSQMERPMM